MLKFFIFFLVALFIPLVGGGVFFAFQIRSIEEDVLEANVRTLGLVREIVDSTSGRIDLALSNLRRDPALQSLQFMEYPRDRSRITAVAEAHRTSLISKVSDPYLIDIFAYFSSPRILFTQNEIYLSTEKFYGSFFEEADFDHDEWLAHFAREQYFGSELVHREIVYRGVPRSVIELRYSLPPVPRTRNRGVVAALVDRDAIARLIQEQLTPEGGVAVIATDDGGIVVQSVSPGYEDALEAVLGAISSDATRGVEFLRTGSGEIAVAYERSPGFGWVVASGVPRHLFLEQSQRIVTLIIVVAAIALLFGIPLSLLLAYRTSKPLLEISDVLRDGVVLSREPRERGQADELNTISESVYELTQRHASLRQRMDEQKPFVRQVIIDRLMRGDFSTENELRATLRHYDVDIDARSYGVFCVFIDGYYDEANDEVVYEFIVKSTLVREQLEVILPPGSLVHAVSLNRIGAVVRLTEREKAEAETEITETVRRVSRAINARKDVRCIVVPGPRVERLFDVPESLRAAMSALRDVPEDGSGVDTPAGSRDSCYYYPADLEARIVNIVESGRTEELESLLGPIEEENFERRSLSVRMLKALADELEGTRHKILARFEPEDEGGWPVPEPELSINDHIRHQLQGLRELARRASRRNGHEHKYKRAILDFVNTHFSEPDMGLKRLALEFSFSEVYLSHLFRQIAGTTFSSYLEQLRMDEAAGLLRATRMTVDQVAEHVGYGSAHVFRRAFKRRFGVSPSAFVDSVTAPSRDTGRTL